LDDALKQLASELRAVDADLVEVLVSDNASSDHTAEIVAEAVQRGMAIRYIRNAEDVGADANVAQCFNEAQGQYVMMMGDDDDDSYAPDYYALA
jgi:glycosyltransferase involved in cell wall biosynthesis